MVNCNPETVSTDYDTRDRLYFEPLTREDVLNVIAAETAAAGGVSPKVIVWLGGQTPLKLSDGRSRSNSSPAPRHRGLTSPRIARSGTRCAASAHPAAARRPPRQNVRTSTEEIAHAHRLSGARAAVATCSAGGRCRSCTTAPIWQRGVAELTSIGSLGKEGGLSAERPVLVDHFLEEHDRGQPRAIRDSTGEVLIGGVMEHVEEAGVHSGDSASAIPPQTLPSLGRRGDRELHQGDRRRRSTCSG